MGRRRDLSYQKKKTNPKVQIAKYTRFYLPSSFFFLQTYYQIDFIFMSKTLDKKPETSVYLQNCLISTTVKT